MGKFGYTWELMGASWSVLKKDKTLVLFPMFSGFCCFLVLLSFAIPLFATGAYEGFFGAAATDDPAVKIAKWVVCFLFYFCTYFVMTFFNVCITASAIAHLAGGTPSFGGAFREAFRRIHLITAWALVQATVGMIIRMIEQRSKFLGKLVMAFMGAAWTITTYMVVPILVVEEKGPFAAIKESAKLLYKNWGAELTGRFSFGLVFFVLSLPAYALIFFAVFMGAAYGPKVMMVCIALAIVYLICLSLMQSALQSIFQAALYMYTQGALAGAHGFPVKLLKDAME